MHPEHLEGYQVYESPIGYLEIFTHREWIVRCHFSEHTPDHNLRPNALSRACIRQLNLYFSGNLKKFELPLYYEGTTFQNNILKMVEKIPFGEILSYGDLARRISNISVSRAIGHAISLNPLLILVPCHRVLSSSGKITGYAGGAERKRWLLDHELKFSSFPKRLF